MDVIQIEEEMIIKGITTRTKNSNETDNATAKIGKLYQQFDQDIVVDYKSGARVYGVYFDYESDAAGEFSVMAGADRIESSKVGLKEIIIPKGKYLIFEGVGEMPKAVIDTWGKIWEYFSEANVEYQRAYKVDFEHYKSETEVNICISII